MSGVGREHERHIVLRNHLPVSTHRGGAAENAETFVKATPRGFEVRTGKREPTVMTDMLVLVNLE
jgi:hypothetical protein